MTTARLELHYHLRDQSHTMDALVRNKCEAEVLAAFTILAAYKTIRFHDCIPVTRSLLVFTHSVMENLLKLTISIRG